MGHQFQSDLRRWDIVASLCKSIDALTYIEVGCREGRTTGFVLKECPRTVATAIDPWIVQDATEDSTRETYKDWNFEKIESEFWKNVGPNSPRCVFLRKTSEEAATNDFKEVGGIDVVFIDALHDYESVNHDISLWWPKVRVGGYLVMHDYNHKWPGVMRAVSEHFNLMDVCLAPDSIAFVKKVSQ